MKSIYKNNEKKQRVRILATGELGTVTDRVLMRGRDGRARPYVQVRLDNRPGLDRWFWADQLGGTTERCRVTFENEDGQMVTIEMQMDYERRNLSMEMSGKPKNLKEHQGLHAFLIHDLLDGISLRG